MYAILSAFFAALTAILAKIGVKNVDSNLATAIRSAVILVFAWGIVVVMGSYKSLPSINKTELVFIILSGVATGLSWLFYFKALQMGTATQVAPIDKLSLVLTILLASLILKEKMSPEVVIGGLLMTIGSIIIALAK